MLDNILDTLRKDLASFLSTKSDLTTAAEKPVVLTRLVNNDGSVDIPDGTLGLTLVNIKEETAAKHFITGGRVSSAAISVSGAGQTLRRSFLILRIPVDK